MNKMKTISLAVMVGLMTGKGYANWEEMNNFHLSSVSEFNQNLSKIDKKFSDIETKINAMEGFGFGLSVEDMRPLNRNPAYKSSSQYNDTYIYGAVPVEDVKGGWKTFEEQNSNVGFNSKVRKPQKQDNGNLNKQVVKTTQEKTQAQSAIDKQFNKVTQQINEMSEKAGLPVEKPVNKYNKPITANLEGVKLISDGSGVGDIKAEEDRKEINKSNYTYDYEIYYDLYLQYEKLQRFIDHPKISEKAKQYVRNTVASMENFFAVLNDMQGQRFVIVNIPSFHLVAYDENHLPALESKVVVGKKDKQTPFETINITSLKYNPDWTPTKNMIHKYIFNEGNGGVNINYLKSHGLKAYLNGKEVPFEEIDETKASLYRFKQPSGINNALGVLKFETNSKSNIYLHDTNQPYLFKNKIRAKSSGCVRVQNYLDLASWLVTESTHNQDQIIENIDKKKMFFRKVGETPVFFTYFQALVNERNKLITFNNLYDLTDEEIQNAVTWEKVFGGETSQEENNQTQQPKQDFETKTEMLKERAVNLLNNQTDNPLNNINNPLDKVTKPNLKGKVEKLGIPEDWYKN